MVKDDERDVILPDSSVFPHKIDWIVGDGHCLFRAISKSITGTQKNHQAVRKVVVKWMVCSDHPTALAKYIVSYDWLAEIERDKSKCPQAIQNYIDTSGMSIAAWGSDKEMVALATMLQTTIFVSNNASGKRVWNCFHPLFWNPKYCMEKSNYKLYLHHSDSRTHCYSIQGVICIVPGQTGVGPPLCLPRKAAREVPAQRGGQGSSDTSF